MRSLVLFLILLTLSAFPKDVVADASFRLVTNGPVGEYVSGGEPRRFTSPARTTFVNVLDRNDPIGTDFFRLQASYEAGVSIRFDVGTDALGANLSSGNYPRAQRASFASAGFGGIDVSMLGNGCSRISGSFVIHSVAITASQEVESIDVSFTQLCEEREPALIGRFTYSASGASIPELAPYASEVAAPVPALGENGIALLFIAIAVIGAMTNRRKRNAN